MRFVSYSSWMICVMGGKCLYNCWLVECWFLDLLKKKTRYNLMLFLSCFFLGRFVKILGVQPFNNPDMATVGNNSRFNLSERNLKKKHCVLNLKLLNGVKKTTINKDSKEVQITQFILFPIILVFKSVLKDAAVNIPRSIHFFS